MKRHLAALAVLAFAFPAAAGAAKAKHRFATLAELEHAMQAQEWNEVAQIAQEILSHDKTSAVARLKGGYALFQLGFSNSALAMLSQIRKDDWASLPEGQERLAEIVSLLQKKVPFNILPSRLDQVDLNTTSPFILDEVRFNKGREAFEQNHASEARAVLEAIPQKSRYFAQAHYLLGALAAKQKNYALAEAEFSKVFLPSLFEQSSELWHDINSQISSHWGAKIKVAFDGDLIAESRKVAELSVLGIARAAYAKKDYAIAIEQYSKIDSQSPYHGRATLEKIWALLNLKRHDEAEKAAASLALEGNSFEALEARPLRALVLTDAGHTEEARKELEEFRTARGSVEKALAAFSTSQEMVDTLPQFLQAEIKRDNRLHQIESYEENLEDEIKRLNDQDARIYPCYTHFAAGLDPLLEQARKLHHQLVISHVKTRRQDLHALALRADLIRVETFLEDREHLRQEFRAQNDFSEAKQLEHDVRLTDLLKKATDGVDEILKNEPNLHEPRLEFRQAELLWELGNMTIILGQAKQERGQMAAGDALKKRALAAALKIADTYPRFSELPRAMFFAGFAQIELGQTQAGLSTLRKFVQKFPQHTNTADAYRILADAAFDANRFKAAEEDYKQILQFPDSPVTGYALYKIGWCAYNEKEFARALLGLEKAVVWSNRSAKNDGALSLQREAQHDLVMLYAEIGDHRKAREYFSQYLPGEPKPWLIELANELDRNGQFEKSADIYRLLISLDPADEKNLAYEARIILGCQQLHRWPLAVKTAADMAENHSSQLATPQGEDTPAAQTEKIMREAVLTQIFEHKKHAGDDSALSVKALNETYLKLFSAWPSSQLPMYKHALFLLERHEDAEATSLLLKHWQRFGAELKEPLREEALRNLIFAMNQAESKRPEGQSASPDTHELVNLAGDYEQLYPQSQHARAISFLRASLLFKYEHNPQARETWRKLFEQNPADDIGKLCFQNLRADLYDHQSWQEIQDWSSALLAKPGLESYVSDLKIMQQESGFMLADSIADDTASGEAFLHFSESASAEPLKEKSIYNAFVRFNKAGQKERALQAADRLQKLAPQSSYLASIAGMRAALYQDAGDYEHAAPLLDAFLRAPPKDTSPDVLAQARLNSGLIAEALGHGDKAARALEAYLNTNPAGPGVPFANRALERMRRSPASLGSFDGWRKLKRASAEFEQHPIPIGTNIPRRIKIGAANLEAIAKKYVDASADANTPPGDALEIYCKVPLFYADFVKELLHLGKSKRIRDEEREEFANELAKIAEPLQQKAEQLAKQCIEKSVAAEHDGTNFREVSARWGNQDKHQTVDNVIKGLQAHAPWLDLDPSPSSEAKIFSAHLQNGGSEQSWYSLARMRWTSGRKGLGRLTAADALARYPKSGRLLNLLAVSESMDGNVKLSSLFAEAGAQGSAAAWTNLALYHLRAARLEPARDALKHAYEMDAFRDEPELASQVKELLQ